MREDIKVLKNLKKRCGNAKIPYQQMVTWNRDRSEGYNEALSAVIKEIDRKIKYIEKKNQNE